MDNDYCSAKVTGEPIVDGDAMRDNKDHVELQKVIQKLENTGM